MSNTVPVVVGGTIAVDNVKTPTASGENLLGGSASYAGLAASYFGDSVYLIGIIGADYPQEHLDLLEGKGISLEGVERSEADSFTWSGEYHENFTDRTTHHVALNVLEGWQVKVPEGVKSAFSKGGIVVLANMSPDNQLEMLDELGGEGNYVIADTMDLWINIAKDRLQEVLGRIDMLVLNESEARDLTGERNLLVAGRKIQETGPKLVIVKVGEFGAYLFGEGDQFFRVPAYGLTNLADPTGAGDSFLGAMAGYLARLGKVDYSFEEIRDGALRGSVAAAFTCEDFSTRCLENASLALIEDRLLQLKAETNWD